MLANVAYICMSEVDKSLFLDFQMKLVSVELSLSIINPGGYSTLEKSIEVHAHTGFLRRRKSRHCKRGVEYLLSF